MKIGAVEVQELRSEVAIEIYETCAYIQKKSQKIVEAKLQAMDNQQTNADSQAVDVDGYLNMIDLINTKLNAFKQRYAELKEQAIAEYKEDLREQAETEEATRMSLVEDGQAAAADKQKKSKKKRRKASPSSSSSSSSDSADSDSEEEEKVSKKSKKKKNRAAAENSEAPAAVTQEEEKKVEAAAPSKKPAGGGLAKPPGAARKLKAPPSSNLHMLRGIREKL